MILDFKYSLLFLLTGFSVETFSQPDFYSYSLKGFRKAEPFNETIDLENPDLNRLNAVAFYLTNEQRKKKNLNELTFSAKLEESATIHSESMVKYNYFDHRNPKSKKLRNPNDRARFVGISNPYLAENIVESFVLRYKAGDEVYPGEKGVFRYNPNDEPIKAHTYLSLGESMMDRWMNSPFHRDNILLKKAVQLGCGTAFYLKEDFNDMPAVIATQNFQSYEYVRVNE